MNQRHIQRERLVDRVAAALRNGVPVALIGPHGSGRTHALRAVAARLELEGVPHALISASNERLRDELESLEAGGRCLLHDLEEASREQLLAIAEFIRTGGIGVIALTDTVDALGFSERLHELYDELPWFALDSEDWAIFHLEPYDEQQIAWLAHRVGSASVTSDVVAAVRRFAWGRPAWAHDLVQLAENGTLITSPRPAIARLKYTDAYLKSLRYPDRLAARTLNEEGVAQAIILSELGPRALSSISHLIGAAGQTRLLDSGILLQTPSDPTLYGVPELYAAAIHHRSDAEHLQAARLRAAEQLLRQERFGIPLSEHESNFCTAALDDADRLDEAPHSLLDRVVQNLIAFGDGEEAKDLLLRAEGFAERVDTLTRARLTALLHSPLAGLQTLLDEESTAPGADGGDAAPHRLASLYLRAKLASASGLTDLDARGGERENEAERDARLVFARWNDESALGADLDRLVRIAERHPDQEVALAAELLVRFECAKQGVRCLDLARNGTEERLARLVLTVDEKSAELVGSLVVVYCLIRAMAGDLGSGSPAETLVSRLPGSERHGIWREHLAATAFALRCGARSRAELEWSLFVARAPRFIPLRLAAALDRLGPEAARSGDRGSADPLDYLRQVYSYLLGAQDPVRHSAFSREPDPALVGVHTAPLALRELIQQHLTAVEARHPVALMKVAERFAENGYWAPAVRALQEARRIYLSRRATGGVAQCDHALLELRQTSEDLVPWFDFDALVSAPEVRLTPRELAAAQLAAQGHSNRTIAKQLLCSVRTVESHLAQARAKLGASDRTELGPLLASLELSSS